MWLGSAGSSGAAQVYGCFFPGFHQAPELVQPGNSLLKNLLPLPRTYCAYLAWKWHGAVMPACLLATLKHLLIKTLNAKTAVNLHGVKSNNHYEVSNQQPTTTTTKPTTTNHEQLPTQTDISRFKIMVGIDSININPHYHQLLINCQVVDWI